MFLLILIKVQTDRIEKAYLHSNMFLLIHEGYIVEEVKEPDLHSNMFLLIRGAFENGYVVF